MCFKYCFMFLGMTCSLLLIMFFIVLWNCGVGSCFISMVLFSVKNVSIMSFKTSLFIITVQFPLSALTNLRLFSFCFVLMDWSVCVYFHVDLCFRFGCKYFCVFCLKCSWCSGCVLCMEVSVSMISCCVMLLCWMLCLRPLFI